MRIFFFLYNKILKFFVAVGVLAELYFAMTNEKIENMILLLLSIILFIIADVSITWLIYKTTQKCPYCGELIDREYDPYTPNNYCGYCGEPITVIRKRNPNRDNNIRRIKYAKRTKQDT